MRIALLLAGLLVMSSCRGEKADPVAARGAGGDGRMDPALLDGAVAMAEVRGFVGLGARVACTRGAARAAGYIAGRLREAGLEPLTDEFEQAVPGGTGTFRNVLCAIDGTGGGAATIILASHYDTKDGVGKGFVGANDSGSSTGLLLALAPLLKAHYRGSADVLLAFLDGEECKVSYADRDGLHGSRRLAKTLLQNQRWPQVKGVLVVDMIGDRDLNVSIPRNGSPSLASVVFDAAHELGNRRSFSLSEQSIIDDHEPFLRLGMPAIDLIDFEYGSAPGLNDYWHSEGDSLDKLDGRSLEIVGRVLIETINRLNRAEAGSRLPSRGGKQ